MFFLLFETFVVYAASWAIWRVIQKRFSPSVLANIPGPYPSSFVTGSMGEFMDKRGWEYHYDTAAKYGSVMKIKGLFGEDKLVVFDPKAMHHIFVKDQEIFEEHPWSISLNALAFGEGLLSTLGSQHRKQRKMLNSVFSIAHLRSMVPIFYEVSHKMRESIAKSVANGPCKVDMVSWMTRTALELIGQSGLGFSFDSLTATEPTHPYTKAVKNLMHAFHKMRFVGPLLAPTLRKIGSARFRRFVINIFPWKALHELRDLIDIMDHTSKEIYHEKLQALQAGDEAISAKIGQGKDIMSILMRANMVASQDKGMTESEILGQMTTLIFAAMDTTSSALSRVVHLLSQHPDIQGRLRDEIIEAREHNGGKDLSYDTLVSLPYLDAICRETLRMYPPVSVANRIATRDVILPLSTPVKSLNGDYIHEIPVPKNTHVVVSVLAANRNQEIWGPDAHEWKPERWLSPLPDSVINAHLPGIYSHLMTFTGGGRSCIGFKFSQLEMKVVLSLLIEAFKFSPPKEEIEWLMTGISSPIVKGLNDSNSMLPLLVESIELGVC